MNLRNFLLTATFVIASQGVFAQFNILNAKAPEEIGVKTEAQEKYDNNTPLEYGYVDDRDILWSKMTWEKIVLDERINFPLYYPVDTMNIGKERRSLFDVLVKNIKNGNIKDIYADSYFTTKQTWDQVAEGMMKIDTADLGYEQFNAGEPISPEYIDTTAITSYHVKEYKIKGLWYFDKRQGELKYRIMALCPVIPDVYFIDSDDGDLIDAFWVFYPDVREVLNEAKSFNNKNTAMPISFDHIMNSRRFGAYMYKEENVYQDRKIDEYIPNDALMQLLESDRIKTKIRDFELDQWQY
ncbi:type IX secretion system ring subunit PorN/GldN [Pseudofulvibacter geojedonensis]|uniref:Gliding motility protein GldN n=1 Tax=Pseudofulvibacter geojedonensis TaxID=1123758 RepID=A0ABW3I419_9FLAO